MNSFFKQFIFVGSLLAVGVQPVFAQALEWAKEGALACVGNHNVRRGGSEITFTGYTFRNFNTDTAITIDSITIFDANGRVLSNMTPGSFPSGFNDLIGPNQTAHFNTRNVFGNFNIRPPALTPLQTIVTWTASERGEALFGNAGRQNHGRNPNTGAIREQRARGILRCVSLK